MILLYSGFGSITFPCSDGVGAVFSQDEFNMRILCQAMKPGF